jgi:glutathione S-transferase
MAVVPEAEIEITAFRWVPPFAAGLVRDLRIRWALEEIERPYRVRLLDAMHPRPHEYFAEQPFGQVPAYCDKDVQLFESGAILIHLGLQDERLLPAEIEPRMRSIAWLVAALNSVEPMIFELSTINLFAKGESWTEERKPQVIDNIRKRLTLLAEALGDREWFESRFSIGNLMMASVLRNLRRSGLVEEQPKLFAFVERCQERTALQRALADQLAVFETHHPEGAAA